MTSRSRDPEIRAEKLRALMAERGREGEPAKGSPPAPPFEANNVAALQHGARSERALAPLAAAIERAAREGRDWPPHLDDERYRSEIESWSWAEAVCVRLRAYLAESDPLEWLQDVDSTEEDVRVREGGSRRRSRTVRQQSALEQLRRWEGLAGNRRAALGLTPVSAAKLARDLMQARRSGAVLGVDLAQAISALTDEGEVQEGGDGATE